MTSLWTSLINHRDIRAGGSNRAVTEEVAEKSKIEVAAVQASISFAEGTALIGHLTASSKASSRDPQRLECPMRLSVNA